MADQLGEMFIDFRAWAAEQAAAAEAQSETIAAELAREEQALATVQSQRDGLMRRYLQRQSGANEEALEHVRQLVTEAERRVADAERRLAAAPASAPTTDAMLDAYNDLRERLRSDGAPLNERLKRLFAQFRLARLDDGAISLLPVLLPDVIEQHGTTPSGSIEGTATPVLLLVPPPTTGLRLEHKSVNAWA